ncbi:tRNA synthetases class I-domain-containing protein [Hygrophoropsis aurantiaca]|uniref:tRNA synthetases class I-domain-containing protein n=1 Tax=Hygrophoropsis aurantiaca TaxID=72124 RepID=A0ACB8A3M6_9AGAM|nr:tRNA synthetases class I-domain-containing protein [Hygrophoropsis aurantiaca]
MILGASRSTTNKLWPRRPPRRSRQFSFSVPWQSDNYKLDSKAFAKTLLLPQTSFPLWTDPSKSEIPFRKRTCEDLYQWQAKNAKGSLFVMHDGPPYANGHLHIGHALNKIIKDIINRYHVLIGDRVHYFPGWDCHGLPIENKALQELKKDVVTLPPNVIRSAAKSTAEREMQTQKEEFQQFGIMADWSPKTTYRTLDHQYEIRQLQIFQKMVEKGLIYRHYRPVHYSPSSRSALAEAELVYKDNHISHSVYVTFAVIANTETRSTVLCEVLATQGLKLLVWTTTPWTLTANMGIAVHPELTYSLVKTQSSHELTVVAKDRILALQDIVGPLESIAELPGADLVDLTYAPLFSSIYDAEALPPLRIIPANHVTSESGTGLVHCAPAHGAEDYLAFRSLGLLQGTTTDMLCHVDGNGYFADSVASIVGHDVAKSLVGQDVLKGGSKAIVQLLGQAGSLVKMQKIKHRYPYDWKTNEPIIVTATSQWFANLDNIKDDALEALKDVEFFPANSRNRLESFVRSRSEWCISRQRVWGVPIPALYHIPTDRPVLDSESLTHILQVLEKHGVAHWWDGPVQDFLPPRLLTESAASEWRKGTDTMDVWFDSGTSWSMLTAPEGGDDAHQEARRFVADVCLEGSDQHRGWFQSQLLTAVGSAPEDSAPSSPYGTLITHGMVLDEAGIKMSKSLGNVVSPMSVINGGKDLKKEPAYGADVLRLWAATVEYWRDMSIGPTTLAQSAQSLKKIRNSARFILGNIGERAQLQPVRKEDLGLAERYIMNELYKLENTAREGYVAYNFPKVMTVLSNFANLTLSSLYLDITKDCLYADSIESKERRVVVATLERALHTMITVMAPVLPHLAEEIHSVLNTKVESNADASPLSFFTKPWVPLEAMWQDVQAEQDMADLLRVRAVVLSLLEKARKDKNLKSSLEAEVDLSLGLVSSDTIDANTAVDKSADAQLPALVKLLEREEGFLKTLFLVSDVRVDSLTFNAALSTASPSNPTTDWTYTSELPLPDSDLAHTQHSSLPHTNVPRCTLYVRVRPAAREKCPRCWTYTREAEADLCSRCEGVVRGS